MAKGKGKAPRERIFISDPDMENPLEEKDVPIGVLFLVGAALWVFIFGAVFSYALVSPCSFVVTVIGDRNTLNTISNKMSLDLTDSNDCRAFLRMTVFGVRSEEPPISQRRLI